MDTSADVFLHHTVTGWPFRTIGEFLSIRRSYEATSRQPQTSSRGTPSDQVVLVPFPIKTE